MATTYFPIQSVTLASSAASVTFSSIPQTYTDLVLRVSARSTDTGSGYIPLQFNGDTGTNYSETVLSGNGSAAASARWSSQSVIWYVPQGTSSNTSNTFGSSEWYIPNYAGTATKAISVTGVQESNSASTYVQVVADAQLYRGSSAITSIYLYNFSGSFVAGSSFHLYGIKNS